MGFDDPENDPPLFHLRRKNDLNSKIMLTAMVSLSLVVVLVTILHIYARCILRRHARRRAAFRQLGIITSAHVHSNEPPKTGLDPSIIASLPTFVFKFIDGEAVEKGSIECSVCLSMLEDGEMIRTLPNCKHTFHAECINKWFSSHSTCPICRTEAEPRVVLVPQPEPREGAIGVPILPIAPPPAPPIDSASVEGAISSGENGLKSSAKTIGSSSSSGLCSFGRILSEDRSSRRIQPFAQEDCSQDLERQ